MATSKVISLVGYADKGEEDIKQDIVNCHK